PSNAPATTSATAATTPAVTRAKRFLDASAAAGAVSGEPASGGGATGSGVLGAAVKAGAGVARLVASAGDARGALSVSPVTGAGGSERNSPVSPPSHRRLRFGDSAPAAFCESDGCDSRCANTGDGIVSPPSTRQN